MVFSKWQKAKQQSQGMDVNFYWQQYGLSSDPFAPYPDHTMLFSLAKWENHLDLAYYLIENKNVLFAVIGSQGMGKTTLANQLEQKINDHYYVHHFKANSIFSTRQLLKELTQGFQLKERANETLTEQLEAQIHAIQYKDKTCVLIIDDAHYLPLETLNSLVYLLKQQSSHQMRLHIVLFGDQNLQVKLANSAKHDLSGEFIHSIELEPLTLEETKHYIKHRMEKAGLAEELPLSQIQLEQIYARSQGNPAQINYYAQQALLKNVSTQQPAILEQTNFMQQHQAKIIGGFVIVIALIGTSYLLNKAGQQEDSNQKPVITFKDQQQQVATPSDKTQHRTAAKILHQAQQNQHEQETTASKQHPSSQQSQHASTSTTPTQQPGIDQHHLASTQSTEPVTKNQSKESSEKTSSKQKQPQISKAKQHPQHQDQNKSQHSTPTNELAHQRQQILHANSQHYTLQLLGVSHENAVKSFIRQHQLGEQAYYYQRTLNDHPWFVLIYGNYKTHKAAEEALQQLPSDLKKYKPFPQKFAHIQKQLRS